ncbi:MAG: metal-sulfur cluster assembly factor [Candidatus ainarchaeum sp.]|nr:metal-sulfur cluster assembly factor [Candidatus ainarchaeum sp.]MDD5096392.1 metal-sulfur cluster assembly factor [Candidatus ainarchaeum sp.]
MPTQKQVMGKLKEVLDPEIGINIVDLGLIYEVKVEKEHVNIKMTFTTPACPLLGYIVNNVQSKVKELKGVSEVQVQFVWEPRWTPERMSPAAKKQLGLQ